MTADVQVSLPLGRIYQNVNHLGDQPFEEGNLSLVVCAIRHYVLDASSSNVLFKSGTKGHIVPFDGYDLVISDGKYFTICALADLRISSLIQKKIITIGSVISRISVRICYSERRSRHRFFLITDLTHDSEKHITIDFDKLEWLPYFDQSNFHLPLLCLRTNFTSTWNITDPVGLCWDKSDAIAVIRDPRQIPRGYTLSQMLVNQHGLNVSPLLVRVFAKSRLNYFARKTGKRLDMNVCPYQFDALVADDRSCCLAVFWGELAVQAFKHVNIGSVLLIRGYRIKQSFKTAEYSAFCFNPAIERFGLEISVNDRLINGKCPFDIVSSQALLLSARLPPVPFNFVPISALNQAPTALSDIKIDLAGVVLYAGRWHREARRYFRSLNENAESPQDESVTEGIVVSSVSGDKYLEEFHTGGYWMWRWLILTDESDPNSIVRLKYYSTSQPELQYDIQPSDAIIVTQLRFLLLNKSDATNSKFRPKWSLTTTNESVLEVCMKLASDSPLSQNERVTAVAKFSKNLTPDHKAMLLFGGTYDYPPYPATMDALVARFQSSTNKPLAGAEPSGRELAGPAYVSAPQLESLIDAFGILEHRCLMVHALVASVKFIPRQELVFSASEKIAMETSKKSGRASPPKRRKRNEQPDPPQLILATSWNERRTGFRGLGVEVPHWRTLTWHWQTRSSEAILQSLVSLPKDNANITSLHLNSSSRLQLNALTNIAGYLHIELLMLNQSIFVNGLIPVPNSCCDDKTLFPKANGSTNDLITFMNACCDSYDIVLPGATPSSRLENDLAVVKNFQKYFNAVSQTPQNTAAAEPPKTAAILACYGLGVDGTEFTVKHLYNLP